MGFTVKISLSWLQYYVDIPVSVEQLCERMIMAGFEVESIEDLSESMDKVVVGKIIRLEKHPDADKLQICQIDIGEEQPVQIVTGADNVFEGALVPAALHGDAAGDRRGETRARSHGPGQKRRKNNKAARRRRKYVGGSRARPREFG